MDNELETEETTPGIDRRTLIKRAGVIGAVAWSVPVVTSFTNRAYAASSKPGNCNYDPSQGTCGGQTPCGTQGGFCNENVTGGQPNGTTYCTIPNSCDAQTCQDNSGCPDGYVCQATCCGDTQCFQLAPADGSGNPLARTHTSKKYASLPN